ncbi:MAG: Na+/H+ antiporter NhaC [Porticoccaceae bacterium]|nr:Na+/H+ antiporter NhaC [Porticoccaceae bacterium]
MSSNQSTRLPTVLEASASVLSLILGVGISVGVFKLYPQIPTLLGVCVAALIAWRCGFNWEAIEDAMIKGVTRAIPAIIIFLLIGILIGVWIVSGVVPTMLYYGIQVLSADVFLPSALIICAVASLATGTSWGTSGTIGLALIGIGNSLGFPLPLVAGAVISGAYFGDKMSPLSDTTNLASSMAGTDLYTHIRHMSKTTGIAFSITLLIEIILGFKYSTSTESTADVGQIMQLLTDNFVINPIMLLPPMVLILLSSKKVPPIPAIAAGILLAALIGLIVQDASVKQLMKVSYSGFESATGVATIDALLTRGGIASMSYTITIVLVAMMFGGIMEKTQQLKVLIAQLLERSVSTASLVCSAVLTTFAANLVLCEQYMSVIVGARTYAKEFEARGLHAKNLSRIVEDSGTVTACLVPWTSGAAYQASVLGVATLAYAPFAFFCWISPLVSLVFGIFNIDIAKIEDDPETHFSIED